MHRGTIPLWDVCLLCLNALSYRPLGQLMISSREETVCLAPRRCPTPSLGEKANQHTLPFALPEHRTIHKVKFNVVVFLGSYTDIGR